MYLEATLRWLIVLLNWDILFLYLECDGYVMNFVGWMEFSYGRFGCKNKKKVSNSNPATGSTCCLSNIKSNIWIPQRFLYTFFILKLIKYISTIPKKYISTSKLTFNEWDVIFFQLHYQMKKIMQIQIIQNCYIYSKKAEGVETIVVNQVE